MVIAKYSCRVCGIFKRAVEVNDREPDRDVVEYVKGVAAVVWLDHRAESPRCVATHIHELYVPISPDGEVGRPVRH